MNKDIENLKAIVEDLEDADNGAMIRLSKEEIESLRAILKLIEKQQKQINELKDILISIRCLLKYCTIYKDDDGICHPTKNLEKQQVYKIFVFIRELLKANYVFLEDDEAINLIIEEVRNGKETKENN